MTKIREDVRRVLVFVLVFAVLPSVLRLFSLADVGIPSVTMADQASWGAYVTGVVVGTLQDVSVGILVLGAVLLGKRLVGVRTAAALAVTLFVVFHLYYLLDFLLFHERRMRMSHTLLEFLKWPAPFIDSAWATGLGVLLTAGVFILAAGVLVWRLGRRSASARFGTATLTRAAIFVVAVVVGTQFLPRTTHYAAGNIVFRDMQNIVYNREHGWFDGGDVDAVAEYLTPQAEEFERIDPAYPLLKRTTGFYGPTHFDVLVTPEERPHVVLLFMESFNARDVGILGAPHQPSASPNFDRMAEEGVVFTNFYASGVQTTRAVMASLFGIYPRFSRRAIQSDVVDYPLTGLPGLFQALGYRNAFFHNGSLSFARKEDFFPRHGYPEMYGGDDVRRWHPEAGGTSWGVFDEFLMEDLANWLTDVDAAGMPGFITAFTVTNHHPWRIPDDFQPPAFAVRPENAEHRAYLRTFSYSDHALGSFTELLRQRGLAEKVVLFVLSDTGQPLGSRDENYMVSRHLYEENLRVPLLIWAPGRIAAPIRVDEVGSQVDLMATVMDVLGMTGVNHSVGTSLRRIVPGRVALFNNPFHLRLWGARAGRYKYVVSQAAETEVLYDLAADPGERRNVAAAHPEVVTRLRARVSGVANVMAALYAERRFVPARW